MVDVADKFLTRGATSLTDRELFELLLEDMPNARECVEELFAKCGNSLQNISREDIARLRMISGIGVKRAQRIVAAIELGRRATQASAVELTTITSSRDVINYFKPKLESLQHEECWILYLTSSNSVIETQRISVGGVTSTVVDHRLIIKRALELLSSQFIMIHNHPSGSIEPSGEDVELTEKVKTAAQLFDIKLLDHIIIGRSGDYSFLNSRLL